MWSSLLLKKEIDIENYNIQWVVFVNKFVYDVV